MYEGYKLFLKWDMKDEVVFSENRLNHNINWYNIDQSFGLDGLVTPKGFGKYDINGNKLLHMKVTNLNNGIEMGTIQALYWQVK